MILALCIDDKNGISFNKRRQSRDSLLIKDLVENAGDRKIYTGSYSSPLFAGYEERVIVDDDYFSHAGEEDICFSEGTDPAAFADSINGLILYRWNRHYPTDKKFTLDLSGYELIMAYDFVGSSHDKISKEVYSR